MTPRDAALAEVPAARAAVPSPLPLVLTGTSAAVHRLRTEIDAAASAPCVLVEAEAGLDVHDVVRALRRDGTGPFVTVSCASAEPGAVERELFGDAHRRSGDGDHETVASASAVAQARGGLLYLEDAGDLSATAQARLARLIRDGEAAIGGTVSPLPLTVVASAVPGEAEEGMRRDLLRHLMRHRLEVPPLRRRAGDLPLLVEQVLAAAAARSGLPPLAVTHPAMTLLAALPWKGNLVELRQALARLTAGAPGGVIQLEDVLTHVRFDGGLAPQAPAGPLRAARQQFERDYIELVIAHHRGHIGAAAQALGMQRTNLYRKARQLGLAVRGKR